MTLLLYFYLFGEFLASAKDFKVDRLNEVALASEGGEKCKDRKIQLTQLLQIGPYHIKIKIQVL